MRIVELNEKPVNELETLYEKKGYLFLICDGKIVWYWEESEE